MRIFVGSSRESRPKMDELASLLEELGHEPLLWTDSHAFPPGSHTLPRLRELSREVDASIFIFSADDHTWYRDQPALQPRDNVILEYGIFASVLGERRTIIGRVGHARHPSDLAGLTYFDLSKPRDAKLRLEKWALNLNGITREEVLVGRWIKIGPNGYHRTVEFQPDGNLIETRLFSGGTSWGGNWYLDRGILHMHVGPYHLTIFPSADGRVYRGSEVVKDKEGQPPYLFTVIHVPLVLD